MSARGSNYAAPADEALAVTPDDAVALASPSRFLYIGGAGDVTVVMQKSGNTVLFKAVPVGTVLPISVTLVKTTGTTATQIVALY